MDSSVSLSVGEVVDMVSSLGPEEFERKVLSLMPSGEKCHDLGCGRVLVDRSVFMQTRYVLCDIYEDGLDDAGEVDAASLRRYRVEIKYGKKNSRAADVVFGAMFLMAFWLASRFNAVALVFAVLLAAAAVAVMIYLERYKFGPCQCEKIGKVLQSAEK